MTGFAEAFAVPPAPFSGIHAALAGLAADDHLQYALLAGRVGGQSLFGGVTGFPGDLTLQGNTAASLGRIFANSPIVFGPYVPSGEAYAFQYNASEAFNSNFIGGGLNMSGNLTFSQPTFIYESFRGSPTINTNANPGFAAYTVLQALPVLSAGPNAGHNPLNPLILNAGPRLTNGFAGTRTSTNVAGINWAPTNNPAANGAVMVITNSTGLQVAPVWNTVTGSRAELGTIIGMDVRAPAQALFAQSLGIERLTAFYGMRVANPGINNQFGTAPVAAVQSSILTGTNRWFLQNLGTANSEFGAGSAHFNDNAGLLLGNTFALPDALIAWDGANLILNPQTSGPSAGRVRIPFGGILVEGDSFPVSDFIRNTASTNLINSSWRLTGKTSADMADGFGTAMFWTIEDDAAVKNNIAFMSAERAGADNTGLFRMRVYEAGVINQIWQASGKTMTITARSELSGAVKYPPIVPAALAAGDNDDWNGLLTASPNNNQRYWARISGDAAGSIITGIDVTAVQDGDTFELTNIGTGNILLVDEDAGSVAANRFATVDTFTFVLKPNGTATIRYDTTAARWYVVTPAGNVAPLTGFWKFSTTTTMADPGAGTFRVNNATPASVTSVAISDITFRAGDFSPVLDLLTTGDVLYMAENSDASRFIKFNITGVTDNGTWYQIDGTVGNSGTLFGNNKECSITAIFA